MTRKEQPLCAAIVLAAGTSTRLGQPKQLVVYKGETLLARTVRIAQEAGCSPVIVVLGFAADCMKRALLGGNVLSVINPEWPTGMASSLRAGLATWSQVASASSNVLLLVCDQPHIEAADLRKLVAIHVSQKKDVTAAAYAGRLGVPAVFHRTLLAELIAATGDRGARRVIERHRAEAGTLDLPSAELDVDTQEDLKRSIPVST